MGMSKGIGTKENILKTAFELTSKFGLEALSIGELAKTVGMSKSGLFGHFKSKERLQIQVLDFAAESFVKKVVKPSLKEKRGLTRLAAMMDNWRKWSSNYLPGGCPFLSAIIEFDDRPGPVRDHLKKLQATMIGTFERSVKIAIEENEIEEGVDTEQMAYEIYSNMVGYHIYNRLLKDKKAHDKFLLTFNRIIGKPQT